MDRKKLQQIIRKYERGTASRAERHMVDNWYASLIDEESRYPDFDKEAYRAELARKWMGQLGVDETPTHSTAFRWWWAAAVLLVVASVSLLFFKHATAPRPATPQEFATAVGEIKRLLLPDSSVVYLHANAKLTIPAGFTVDHRRIHLEGEAFFDITGNAQVPCIVETNTVTVEVLGTRFNVQAYPTSAYIEVALEHGKVSVGIGEDDRVILQPDERFRYEQASGKIEQFSDGGTSVGNWRDGNVQLRQASFRELALTLENRYGATLTSENQENMTDTYTLIIRKNQSLDQVLEQLHKMTNRKYRKEGNQVTMY